MLFTLHELKVIVLKCDVKFIRTIQLKVQIEHSWMFNLRVNDRIIIVNSLI